MKAATPQLISLLNLNQFLMADLYTITLLDGSAHYYADYDFDLEFGGHVFKSDEFIFNRGKISLTVGTQVDSLDIDIYATSGALIAGATLPQMAHNGGLDGARVKVERVFMPASSPIDTTAGSVFLFEGRLSEVDSSRYEVTGKVNSDLELLNIQMPRNLYQSSCMHSLYDSGCTVDRQAFKVAGTLSAGSTANNLITSLTQAAGYFTQGTIIFTSGANAGVRRTIRSYAGGVVSLTLPLKGAVVAGDAFIAYAGCDNTQATCQAKFSNKQNFRGFPFIPTAETAT